MEISMPHIVVCICTFKRPALLNELLKKLQFQETQDLFRYSIVIVDNDTGQSANVVVSAFKEQSFLPVFYHYEPEQNIALARNKAIQNAHGDYLVFIDDDEFPERNWILNLYRTQLQYGADGVLGPVIPYFKSDPPQWVIKSKLFERPTHPTGSVLCWENTRTGNVLFRKHLFDVRGNQFDSRFGRGGEDRDFFRRIIEKGHRFVWCAGAPVYEVINPERYKRTFLLKRALLRGKVSLNHPSVGSKEIYKSLAAVLIYSSILPVALFLGQHVFMKYLIRDFDHLGRLLAFCGIDLVKENYVMG
jgi:succinoglycan biosynthesis protein ExoM